MEIKSLLQIFSKPGVVECITVRSQRLTNVTEVNSVEAVEGRGLHGDRYNNRDGGRQVTLIQAEHLDAIASMLGVPAVDFKLTRRNILVRGINLLALKDKSFRIGQAVLRYSGECHPCSRMEDALGTGGYNAMRGHGGITAKVIRGGSIARGDELIPIKQDDASNAPPLAL
jgi:MOSC domain-containing protein YiiM